MDTLALVNHLLNTIKERHGLPSDAALARHIGVNEMRIVRWRRGEYGAATRILFPLLLTYGPLSEPDALAAPLENAA